MNIQYLKTDKLLLVELTEEIDHHYSDEIRRRLDYEIERHLPKRVIFNFDKVSFMDSAGIGILLGRYKLINLIRRRNGYYKCKIKYKKSFRT